MPTVADLTEPYGNFLLGPQPGPGVCDTCFNLTDGYRRCYACAHGGRWLDLIVPISYSVAGEQLHHALAAYKRAPEPVARRFAIELAAVLWRFGSHHEQCVAAAAGVDAFPLVTTVPSSDPARDARHPLRRIVGELVEPTRDRYERLVVHDVDRRPGPGATPHDRRSPSVEPRSAPRTFDVDRFTSTRRLAGEPVLLLDDTWTTGANAQSAAAALKRAGAGPVALVVIGRHLNRGWGENDRRLNRLSPPFDWSRCVCCTPACGLAGADGEIVTADGRATRAPQAASRLGSRPTARTSSDVARGRSSPAQPRRAPM